MDASDVDPLTVQEHVDALAAQGFALLPGLVSRSQVAALNQAMNRDLRQHPFLWERGDGFVVHKNALLSVDGVVEVVLEPLVCAIAARVFDRQARFEEATLFSHQARAGGQPPHWHRDVPHNLQNSLRVEYLQLLLYLTDVSPEDHRFAVVPESIHQPSSQVRRSDSPPHVFTGPAGSAILFNASALHAALKTPTAATRRSLHVYFGHRDRPCASQYTAVPERIRHEYADRAGALFDKRNQLATLLFGPT